MFADGEFAGQLRARRLRALVGNRQVRLEPESSFLRENPMVTARSAQRESVDKRDANSKFFGTSRPGGSFMSTCGSSVLSWYRTARGDDARACTIATVTTSQS